MRVTMVLKAAWTSAAEQVDTMGWPWSWSSSATYCTETHARGTRWPDGFRGHAAGRRNERSENNCGTTGMRALFCRTEMVLLDTQRDDRMVRNTHLPRPLGGVDQDDALWEAFVRDEDLVQLVIHRLPGNLRDKWEPDSDWTKPAHIHHIHLHLSVAYLCYETWVWGALALHAAGPVALGLGVLPVFHGVAARTPLQPVFHFTEEETSPEKIRIHQINRFEMNLKIYSTGLRTKMFPWRKNFYHNHCE